MIHLFLVLKKRRSLHPTPTVEWTPNLFAFLHVKQDSYMHCCIFNVSSSEAVLCTYNIYLDWSLGLAQTIPIDPNASIYVCSPDRMICKEKAKEFNSKCIYIPICISLNCHFDDFIHFIH